MLGNEEASIRVWNKYIDNPKGVTQKIAYILGGVGKIAYDIKV